MNKKNINFNWNIMHKKIKMILGRELGLGEPEQRLA
jgi:hypothetical protein